ncbi:gamma-glutamylcyclotransferase [Rhabdobacter roseus]|uniref:Gamma-glutamylcyclotransferase (GGCT)/AIG2-like uncharacterized protein YtfP n=1 Tax=Rhabdobacter roseus TaxID=1655419 RepID=A0A840U170_9BACT|nr:gamma-glutamylcyclotransferase family protein [Rhabdobacter roseus]MBB5287333.1 gamma-glutamylcyclotransferase (GGCT)/AIG2-like uncharacterized protein YtfP [Rhabdobacter roseus]
MQPTYLFVYGTLMRGHANPFAQRLRQYATFVGLGTFPGVLYRIEWYPGAVYQPGAPGRVQGEIFELHEPARLLPELDAYEDVQEDPARSLYLRREVPVQVPDGRVLRCWTYLYNQPTDALLRIESGLFT